MTTSTPAVSLPTETLVSDVKGALTEMGTHETSIGQVKLFGFSGEPLAETEDWKLFIAELPEPKGQLGLMMISTTKDTNDVVEWQEYILQISQQMAQSLNAKSATAEFAPNYDAFFPRVVDSIDTEDGRFAIILAYHPIVASYKDLKPLSSLLVSKRTDLKSVMWILGKSLKLADFFHSGGCTIGKVTPDNVFVCGDLHAVFYLDFSFADDNATIFMMTEEISQMARTAWFAAGGTDTSEPPFDADIMTTEQHAEFVANLKRLMDGVDVMDARTEMDRLYEINDRIWPKVLIADGPNSRGQTHKRQWHEFRLL